MSVNEGRILQQKLLQSWKSLVKAASDLRGAREALVVWVARDTAATRAGEAKRFETKPPFSPDEIAASEKLWVEAQRTYAGASHNFVAHVLNVNDRTATHRLGPRPDPDDLPQNAAAWDAAAEVIIADDSLSAASESSWLTPGRKHLAARLERKALRLSGKADPLPELPRLEDLAVHATSLDRALNQSTGSQDEKMGLLNAARKAREGLDLGLKTVDRYVALADKSEVPHFEGLPEPHESMEFLALYVPIMSQYIQALAIVGQERFQETLHTGRQNWGLLKHIDDNLVVTVGDLRFSGAKLDCWHYPLDELYMGAQLLDPKVVDRLEADAQRLIAPRMSEGLFPPDLSGRLP